MRLFLFSFLISSYGHAVTEKQHVALSIMTDAEQKIYVNKALTKIEDEYRLEQTDFYAYLAKKALLCKKEPNQKNCEVPNLTKSKLRNIYSQRVEGKKAYFSKNEDWKYFIKESELYFWFPTTIGSKTILHHISLHNEQEIFELVNENTELSKYEVSCERNIERLLAECALNSFPAIQYSSVIFKVVGDSDIKLGRTLLSQRKVMKQLHSEHESIAKVVSGEVESYGDEWIIRYQTDVCLMEVFKFNGTKSIFNFKELIFGGLYCE